MSYWYSHLCKSIKSRNFKSKGGVVLLLWEVSVLLVVFHYYHSYNQSSATSVAFKIAVATGVLIFSASGLLGDVVLGRYRAIKYSLLSLWVSTIIHSIADVVVHIAKVNDSRAWSLVSSLFMLFGAIGCGGFLVNSMNFGIDQLMDAPSRQISSYISWYSWCFYVSDVLSLLVFKCSYYPWSTLGIGFVAFVITIALCVDIFLNTILVKEPISSNPLKLVINVLKYAARNKYPRSRSAFSYWDEKKSRIDLSKTKYGGPFTFEEVEDVKTFLRMLGIIFVGGFFTGYFIVFADTEGFMLYRFRDDSFMENIRNLSSYGHCLVRQAFSEGASFLLVVGVPLFEFFIYPLLQKYSVAVTILSKFKLGMFFLLISQLNYIALDVAGYVIASDKNSTVPCLLYSSNKDLINERTFSISFYWLGMPILCNAVAYYLMFTSTAEFLYTQSPYSMKGLLMGLTYSFVSLFIVVNSELRNLYKKFKWHNSCGTLYFLVSSVLTFVLIIVICIIIKWYSRRRRRDNNDDEEFVESYKIQYRCS